MPVVPVAPDDLSAPQPPTAGATPGAVLVLIAAVGFAKTEITGLDAIRAVTAGNASAPQAHLKKGLP